MHKSIAWLRELSRDDTSLVGGEGANLGELTRAGFPVPPGFVVTSVAYWVAMDVGGVRSWLRDGAAAADPDDAEALRETAASLRELVTKVSMPDYLVHLVETAYHELGSPPRVAVRSSTIAEDASDTSCASMNRTFTNVAPEDLRARIVACWASLFGERLLAYRAAHGVRDEPAIAVVVQTMVDADRSGVMFSADPATGDRSRVVIEAAFGLGEAVVSGAVEPDTYVVDKDGPRLVSARVGQQAFAIRRGPNGADQRVELSAQDGARRVLTDDEALTLTRLATRVEQHYGSSQAMEWAFEGKELFLVQSRPITAVTAPPGSSRSRPQRSNRRSRPRW